MKSAGSILKERRVEKNILLEEATMALRIHPKFLKALEESDYSKFSNPIQLKGFLKNYCEYLGLNKDEVLAFFRREYDEESVRKTRSLTYRTQNLNFFHLSPKAVAWVFITISLIAFFSYIFYQYRSFAKPPFLAVESPSSDIAVQSPSLDIFLKADPEAEVGLNGQKLLPQTDGSFAFTVSLSKGVNALNFTAVNKLGKSSSITRKILAEYEDLSVLGAVTEKTGEEAIKEDLEINIEIIKDASYLTVFADSQKTFDGIVLAGAKVTFNAKREIKIKAGNAGVARITKNGEFLGVMGKEGEVIENIYTKSPK